MNTSKKRFSIIGCGRVGVSLAVFLSGKGFEPAGFFSRTRASAQFARDMAGLGTVFGSAGEAAQGADILFITTPDTLIETVCKDLAASLNLKNESMVFHLSGALSSDILESARECGAAVGSIHPLQAFTPYEPGQDNPFENINISVEGSRGAVCLGKEIVRALGAKAFTIPTEAKTLYHASAVVASNYLVTLEKFALNLLMETGLDEARAYEILEPLIQGTLANIKAKGCDRALTGPVARGDDKIVSSHIKDIDAKTPQFSKLYRVLGAHTLDIARPGVDKQAEHELSRLFKS
ncbi:MAG: DUF2520 domain-containing protein [Desulfobacter sp.]|nr:DUF2520 domain-containing protein [Desulfobacter sp.]WDP84972.1 MAG: DUF2520 domain-containing protein [Desulfobacter sp.]